MTTFPNGIHLNIPADVYHAANGVSNSMLANMDPPARLPVYLSKKREVTPYMRLGTLIHHAILEPEKPMPGVWVQPLTYETDEGELKAWHNGAKKCKDEVAKQKAAGNEVLKLDEFSALRECVRALESDELVANSLAVGEGEVSVAAPLTLPSGRLVLRRARVDWLRRGQCIYDIKKVGNGNASKRQFERLAWDRRYFVQAAYYLDAWNSSCAPSEDVKAFCFFVVEDEAPYLVGRYEIQLESREHLKGREIYMRDLETYALCKETGKWPGYGDGFEKLELPYYAK
jgi:hypothetical protein